MKQKDLMNRFNQKIEELEKILPDLKKGVNCAELTLTNILDVLGVDNYMFHNLAMPLAGGFGGYKSKKGWQGACGAVAGACASIGVIMGGNKKMNEKTMVIAYLKASKYAKDFENEFGSVVCSELCGFDFSDPNGFIKYRKTGTWKKKCYKFVVWAVDKVRKVTRNDLKRKWQ
ncbi:MAG: C-GCAxxG-C-C family (seleno)protein [Promethearchaeota archaeon]